MATLTTDRYPRVSGPCSRCSGGAFLGVGTSLLDVLGYAGLFAGIVLILRVVLAALRETR